MGPITPVEEQKRYIEAYKNSDMEIVAYCNSAGLNAKTFSNWLTKHGARKKSKPFSAYLESTHEREAPVTRQDEDRAFLLERIQTLTNNLHDANVKITSLQNVIVILGHQVGS